LLFSVHLIPGLFLADDLVPEPLGVDIRKRDVMKLETRGPDSYMLP
jgi:hypothetical protein